MAIAIVSISKMLAFIHSLLRCASERERERLGETERAINKNILWSPAHDGDLFFICLTEF